MTEKKYETVSETYIRIRNTLLSNNDGAEWLADSGAWEIVDKLFISKKELKEKINKICCPEYGGLVAVSDDVRKILKLLEE